MIPALVDPRDRFPHHALPRPVDNTPVFDVARYLERQNVALVETFGLHARAINGLIEVQRTIYAEDFPGDDVGQRINAALASIVAGTVVIASSGTISTAVTVGSGKQLVFGAGTWTIAATITLSTNSSVLGNRTLTTFNATAAQVFAVAGFYTEIEGFKVDMSGAAAGSTVILYKTGAASVYDSRVRSLFCQNCYSVMKDEVHASNALINLIVQDVRAILTKGRQIYISRSTGFILLRDVCVDHTYNATQPSFEGIRIENFGGIEFERVDVVGPSPAIVSRSYDANQVGIVCSSGQAVWLYRTFVDSGNGPGVQITSTQYVWAYMLEASLNMGDGIKLTSCTDVNLTTIYQGGCIGVGGAPLSVGVEIVGCSRFNASNIESRDNTGDALKVTNSTDGNVSNCVLYNNGGRGLYENGTSDRNIFANIRTQSNSGSSIVVAGANSAVLGYIPGSGTFAGSVVGPLTVA